MSIPGDPSTASVPPSIDTTAIREAEQLVDSHLRLRAFGPGAPVQGQVVGVAGPPGSGKSHLAVQVVRHCWDRADTDGYAEHVRPVLIAATGLDADGLYRAFVNTLPQEEVLACVRAYHAGLVARRITDTPLAGRAAEYLRTPGQTAADREDYVAGLGQSPVALLEQLKALLVDVVGDAEYATALTLLLRDGLGDVVWGWLRGDQPRPVLRERGLTGPAAGGANGIEVFARLYGQQDYRLVLVLDDIDQIDFELAPERQRRALRGLLEQTRTAGSLTFLTGPADALDDLETGPSRRSGRRITMTGFDPESAIRFLRTRSDTGTLAPFEADAVTRIVDLTDGNPRLLGEFADHLLRIAWESGAEITESFARAQARQYFAVAARARVATTIRRVLDNHLWPFRTEHPAALGSPVRVDFWIPVPGVESAGCAVLVADTILDDADVRRLTEVNRVFDMSKVSARVLVVLIGATSALHTARIEQEFRRAPLHYVVETFDEDLAAAVKAMLHSFGDIGNDDQIAGLRERIDRIDRQQSRTLAELERLRLALPVAGGRPRIDQPTPGERPTNLPGPLQQPFTRTLAAVEQLLPTGTLAQDLFAAGETGTEALNRLRRIRNADPTTVRAIGTASLVIAFVREFRDAIQQWYPGPDRSDPADRQELARLCTRFDAIFEVVPLGDLRRLPAAQDRSPRADSAVDSALSAVRDLSRTVRGVAERLVGV